MGDGFRIITFSPRDFMSRNDINVNFFENEKAIKINSFNCALIIGENGSGKTEFVIRILEALSEIEKLQKKNKIINSNKKMKFYLKYYLNGVIYEIDSNLEYIFKKNGEQVNISKIELPNKFIAQSFSFADKFNYYSEGRYSYLGTRTASNASYISHIENRISEIISSKMEELDFIEFLLVLLDFLKFDQKLEITFEVKSLKQLSEILDDRTSFISKYTNLRSDRRIKSNVYSSFTELRIDLLHGKICDLTNKFRKNEKEITYLIDINKNKDYGDLKDYFVFMRILSYMRILSTPKVKFYKHKAELFVSSASSGEKQLLYSLLNIYSVIESNSLIVIDEPEISLHPNWQMQYMKLLETAFVKFRNCHFIIASHSHFMVSDLKKEESTIIVMSRDIEKFSANIYKSDTYSWSAEDILYNVFTVPSSRNYYIASDVEDVIKAISTGSISEDTINKVNTFKEILPNLKDADPLKTIIKNILERVMV